VWHGRAGAPLVQGDVTALVVNADDADTVADDDDFYADMDFYAWLDAQDQDPQG